MDMWFISGWNINTHLKSKENNKNKENQNNTNQTTNKNGSTNSTDQSGIDSFPTEPCSGVLSRSLTHLSLDRRSALSFRTCSSSKSEYLPTSSAFRSTSPSMLLVRQSASIALLLTQRNRQFSSSLSLIKRHSKVVLCSAQDGVEVLVERSYTDLQSVATTACGAIAKTLFGSDQSLDFS